MVGVFGGTRQLCVVTDASKEIKRGNFLMKTKRVMVTESTCSKTPRLSKINPSAFLLQDHIKLYPQPDCSLQGSVSYCLTSDCKEPFPSYEEDKNSECVSVYGYVCLCVCAYAYVHTHMCVLRLASHPGKEEFPPWAWKAEC